MDELASNYNSDATEDDPNNPCNYPPSAGCMDDAACNYNADAIEDDGSCQVPSENALIIVNYDQTVEGPISPMEVVTDEDGNVVTDENGNALTELKIEELTAYIDIRNESCDEITISASQELTTGGGQGWGEIKFCLGDVACYPWGINDSTSPEDDLAVASFEEINGGVTGYLYAKIAGTYIVTYTIEPCCGEPLEVDVAFIVK